MSARDDGRALLRWHRVEALWDGARAITGRERTAFLDRETRGDPELRAELEDLLDRAELAEAMLERLNPLVGRGADDAIRQRMLDQVKIGLAHRYDVGPELGRGGSAAVFLGRDRAHDRAVAIKVLHPEITAAIGARRFEREIRLVAQLEHPNILPVTDSGAIAASADHAGRLWYAMPLMSGSLRGLLASGGCLGFSDSVLGIASDLAAALDYAHSRGIIHRDVKPENVLLDGGRALLADFGIARAFDVSEYERLTGTGFIPGTPPYMSPEQASSVENLDGRSDLFSLACVVHEMIFGRPPARSLTTSPADPVVIQSDGGFALCHVLERALAPQPRGRFPTGREFISALARVGNTRT